MSYMTRWNPVRDMMAMQNVMERAFNEAAQSNSDNDYRLALDVDENENGFVVTTSLPGVNSDDIDIRVDDNVLTITAEIPETTVEHEGARAVLRERRRGRYSRSIRLSDAVDVTGANADYTDGVLILTLPKSPEQQPRMIPVRSAPKNG